MLNEKTRIQSGGIMGTGLNRSNAARSVAFCSPTPQFEELACRASRCRAFAEDRELITNEVVGRMSLTDLLLLDGGEIG